MAESIVDTAVSVAWIASWGMSMYHWGWPRPVWKWRGKENMDQGDVGGEPEGRPRCTHWVRWWWSRAACRPGWTGRGPRATSVTRLSILEWVGVQNMPSIVCELFASWNTSLLLLGAFSCHRGGGEPGCLHPDGLQEVHPHQAGVCPDGRRLLQVEWQRVDWSSRWLRAGRQGLDGGKLPWNIWIVASTSFPQTISSKQLSFL